MPKYLLQKQYLWVPGDGPQGTEDVPLDLRDDRGVLIRHLALWPAQPFEIDAHDEDDAVERGAALWESQGHKIFLNQRVSKQRLDELISRERPGSQGRFTSVNVVWVVKSAADHNEGWHSYTQTFLPKT